jgi:hypothetical protein
MQDNLKIITTVSAWPEALEYQAKLLKKFCKDDYEFIAIIDADLKPHYSNMWNKATRKQALEIARKYCQHVIEMPIDMHENRTHLFPNTCEIKGNKPSLRTADSCQYAWNYLKEMKAQRAILIDSDMFPISHFSFEDLTKDKNVGAVKQTRESGHKKIEYFWNGIIAANFASLPSLHDLSFDAGYHEGLSTDTGGGTHSWVAANVQKVNWIEFNSSLNWTHKEIPDLKSKRMQEFIINDDRNIHGKIYSEIYAGSFFHFRGGGNWNMEPRSLVYARRRKIFAGFAEIICEDLIYEQPRRNFSLTSLIFEFYYYLKWLIKRKVK